MNNGTNVSEFFDDQAIKEEVEGIWAGVFEATYNILKMADIFGFDEIEVKSNPNIHQLITAAATVDFMLTRALEYLQECEDVDHDLIRLLINAQEQINRMQLITTALKTKDRDLYNTAIEKLRAQAPF